jgi:hypothetical protein
MRRLLAVIGAVGIVALAIVVRGAIDDRSDGGNGSDGGDNGDGDLVLICAADLADACTTMEGAGLGGATIIEQAAATTAVQIEDGALPEGADGWVTTTAWTEVVDTRAPGRIAVQEVLATSPVVVAVDPARASAVTDLCGGDPIWRCLGDHAGEDWASLGGDPRWGSLKVGLPSASSAGGLAVLAAVASGHFGGTDFASNDFDATGFATWLSNLAGPSGSGEELPVRTLVTTRGKYSAVGDLEASAAGRAAEALTPSPAVDATAVLVTLPGGDDLPDGTPLREAIVDVLHWQPASGEAPPPTLKPGVMAALHTLWMEVTR